MTDEGTIVAATPGFVCVFLAEDRGRAESVKEDIIAWRVTTRRVLPVTINNEWASADGSVTIEHDGVVRAILATKDD